MDCYCVCCELLSASKTDALKFVNMVCLPLITEQNALEKYLTQECLQIVRRLFVNQTTTHSIRNNNPMFDQQPLTLFFCPSQYVRVGTRQTIWHKLRLVEADWRLVASCPYFSQKDHPTQHHSVLTCLLVLLSFRQNLEGGFAVCLSLPYVTKPPHN